VSGVVSGTAVVPAPAVVIVTMVLVAGAIAASLVAVRGGSDEPSPSGGGRDRTVTPRSAPRVWLGVAVGVPVLAVTRWPVLALAAGLLAACWTRWLRDDAAADERRRVEGIAKWLEDLRDTLRGSSVGTEEALEQVALRAPEAVRAPLATFVLRRRQGFRTEDALADLADALAHPTSDAAIAAIRLVVSGSTGAGRLHPTVSALAAAARDEVRARERVDRTRALYRASMTRLVMIAVALLVYLRLAAGELLEPYATPLGQVILLMPLTMWAGCLAWMRSLCRYEPPARYRITGSLA
jgi:hypothetical protein